MFSSLPVSHTTYIATPFHSPLLAPTFRAIFVAVQVFAFVPTVPLLLFYAYFIRFLWDVSNSGLSAHTRFTFFSWISFKCYNSATGIGDTSLCAPLYPLAYDYRTLKVTAVLPCGVRLQLYGFLMTHICFGQKEERYQTI
jgi:hypothetical protein